MYLDQLFYFVNFVLEFVKKINCVFQCVDQIEVFENGEVFCDWFVLIVVDVEVGFGGQLNCFEIMKVFIEVGVVGVYFEDQVVAEKKCGYLGGKVLILISQYECNFVVVCLVVDVMGVLIIMVVCIDVELVILINFDIDECDYEFIDFDVGCILEGFFCLKKGMGVEYCIKCGLVYVKVVDLLWWEIFKLNLDEVCCFVEVIQKEFLGKMMVYNCLLFFNWEVNFDKVIIEIYQCELGVMGYKFQFVILVGFYSFNYGMFEFVCGYKDCGMGVYFEFQQVEFVFEVDGYIVMCYQCEVGMGYFDKVFLVIFGGKFLMIVMGVFMEIV